MTSSKPPRSSRHLCIHGHFYQPPRENPWLEAVQVQDSAYPYHDWNDRITDECYARNASSRILDEEGLIESIVNNYARISFDFGPTLLSWLVVERPDLHAAIVQADRTSRELFGGHGSAMAQGYSHAILPLCDERDLRTQVHWGRRDFEHRFGRAPEGMWLPETAVDVPTLEALAAEGIAFTVLEPHQAARWREMGESAWCPTSEEPLDPRRPYRCPLPSGRSIDVFFYDGRISRAVAFEGLLSSGEGFAGRLVGQFRRGQEGPQLVHIATDGETYGHHHRFGDMALAYALRHIEREGLARLTNYGQYLEEHPARHEVQIVEDTSWSCAHGIERWRSDCGCGGAPGWNQAWRAPLRAALDWLRDRLRPAWERLAGQLLVDPWAARDDYIELILDRSPERIDAFLDRHAARELEPAERVQVLELLELQRHAMLMFTSCGWFFEDLARIETVQVLLYAARVIQIAEEQLGDRVEEAFLERLSEARSNDPQRGDGRRIWEQLVRPSVVSLSQVGAHYALTSLFEDPEKGSRVYCYAVEDANRQVERAGAARLVRGTARITHELTREARDLRYCALHLGDHSLVAGVRPVGSESDREALAGIREAFVHADVPETLRRIDRAFDGDTYTLRSLFKDEQRRIVARLVDSSVREASASYRLVLDRYAPLMRYLVDLGSPMPPAFRAAAEQVVVADLRACLETEVPDVEEARELLEEARELGLEVGDGGMRRVLEQSLRRLADLLLQAPEDRALLQRLERLAVLAGELPFEVDFWEVQNRFWALIRSALPRQREREAAGDAEAAAWCEHFLALGRALRMRVR